MMVVWYSSFFYRLTRQTENFEIFLMIFFLTLVLFVDSQCLRRMCINMVLNRKRKEALLSNIHESLMLQWKVKSHEQIA